MLLPNPQSCTCSSQHGMRAGSPSAASTGRAALRGPCSCPGSPLPGACPPGLTSLADGRYASRVLPCCLLASSAVRSSSIVPSTSPCARARASRRRRGGARLGERHPARCPEAGSTVLRMAKPTGAHWQAVPCCGTPRKPKGTQGYAAPCRRGVYWPGPRGSIRATTPCGSGLSQLRAPQRPPSPRAAAV